MSALAMSKPFSPTLPEAYQSLLTSGGWQRDAAQTHAITALANLLKALSGSSSQPPKGLYLHGPVGRGKSQLLNLFMQHLPSDMPARRVHMHAFMQEVHRRLAAIEKGDPIQQLASELAQEATVLGFDEFYVTNIADAMLLGRLFQYLFKHHVVVIATSNWPPEDLFQNGLNRDRFLPFLRLITKHLDTIDLSGGPDYRTAPGSSWPLYLTPDHKPVTLARLFEMYADGPTEPLPLGFAPKKHSGRCAWFTFEDLCEQPLGRTEYLNLIRSTDTLIIEGVPRFEPADADAALRFVTLVDIAYDHRRRLVIKAAAFPQSLCTTGVAASPFQRAASRLAEMQQWSGPFAALHVQPLPKNGKNPRIK